MKRFFTTLAATAVFALTATAQKTLPSVNFGAADRGALCIPKEFTADGAPLLTVWDEYDGLSLIMYNEQLDSLRRITFNNDHTFDYTLTYQELRREVTKVTEGEKQQYCEYKSFEEFLWNEANVSSERVDTKLNIKKLSNGDSLITFKNPDYSDYQMEKIYFGYEHFGTKYPNIYFTCHNDVVKGWRVSYMAEYTPWEVVRTYEQSDSKQLDVIRLCNINLNQGDDRTNKFFVVSQTLFNDDAEYEYLVPKYSLTADEGDVYYPEPVDELKLTSTRVISDAHNVTMTGFNIMTADGRVKSSIDFVEGFEASFYDDYAFVVTIGNTTYLAFDGRYNGGYGTVFYKIDRATTSVRQVKKVKGGMRVAPAVVDRNAPINVSFDDDNERGSTLSLFSTAGERVKTVRVAPGTKQVEINAAGAPGVYGVSRTRSGAAAETKKIIVK